ncbi:MAG: hypothetical protein QM755_02590 [Luteolibacter sp.]
MIHYMIRIKPHDPEPIAKYHISNQNNLPAYAFSGLQIHTRYWLSHDILQQIIRLQSILGVKHFQEPGYPLFVFNQESVFAGYEAHPGFLSSLFPASKRPADAKTVPLGVAPFEEP